VKFSRLLVCCSPRGGTIEDTAVRLGLVRLRGSSAHRCCFNRWVRHASADADAEAALDDFTRFPRWMWRNRDVVEFLNWLHAHNESKTAASRTGFYGLDLYSLHTSIEAVLTYLRKVDPAAAERARYRY
jgi:erythromycin esterase-like protein